MLYSWSSIINIPSGAMLNYNEYDSLLTCYGTTSYNHLLKHISSYYTAEGRDTQDPQWMHHCIMASLTKEVKARVILHSDQYTYRGIPSGPLLLKVIIQETCVDSNATIRHIRENLGGLNVYIRSINSNITTFNQRVMSLLDSLNACGESTNDLLTSLLKGYKAATDHTFTFYIQRKEEQFDDGEPLTPSQLMCFAKNKYITLPDEGR